MKTYYVYELVNQLGKIEYIGKTYRPEYRFNQHTKNNPESGHGLFYGRTDLTMNLVKGFPSNKQALKFEGEHKIRNGFKWDEKSNQISAGSKGGLKTGKLAVISGQIYELSKRSSKKVNVYCFKTNKFINTFNSISQAARELDAHQSAFTKVCKGKLKQHKGYVVEYA